MTKTNYAAKIPLTGRLLKEKNCFISSFKVYMTRNFLLAYSKELLNCEEWSLFYCDSSLGCRVNQDFDLCKLDDL